MPTAFVTGATGFIGQHLTEQLVEGGWKVRLLKRKSSDVSGLARLDVEMRDGDVTDRDSVFAALKEGADAVFHVAANTSPWFAHRELQTAINIDGTRNVLDAAKSAGAGRFIHTSSVSVYGFHHNQTVTEESPWDESAYWINYYRTKAEGERLVKRYVEEGLDAVVLNPAHIMGPKDQHNWVRLLNMIADRSLPGIPPGSGSFADVREVARAHIRAVEHGRTGENYLLGGENQPFKAVVDIAAELMEVDLNKRVMPAFLMKTLAHIKNQVSRFTGKEPDLTPEAVAIVSSHEACDSGKAIKELDYRITPLRDLLADTITWLQAQKLE